MLPTTLPSPSNRLLQVVFSLFASFFLSMAASTLLAGESSISVEETEESIKVDTGPLQFTISRGADAGLQTVRIGGRDLVVADDQPMLRGTLLESPDYDGIADFADGRFLESSYLVEFTGVEEVEEGFQALLQGRLLFETGDALVFNLRIRAWPGEARLQTILEFEPLGDFEDLTIREVVLDLPTQLDWRKRIAQGGAEGMIWDTRYYYEFPYGMAQLLMPPNQAHDPDRNEWRRFAVEQSSPRYFKIWRAEGDDTPALISQHGERAAGWTSLYDREGGVLFGYQGLAERAPKNLQADAPGGGRAMVYFHPYTAPALFPKNDQAKALFGEPHVVDWIFFEGEHRDANPDQLLAELWEASEPLHGTRPASPQELWDVKVEEWDVEFSSPESRPFVSGGLPLARDVYRESDPLRLFAGAKEVPLQATPLAYWPDGSVKWLHMVFPLELDGGDGPEEESLSDKVLPFEVSLRDEERISYVLDYGARESSPEVEAKVTVQDLLESDEGVVRIDTGPLVMEIGPGQDWIRQVRIGGESILGEEAGRPQAFLDYLRTEETYRSGSTHPAGAMDSGALQIESIEVEEEGPLRAVVRLEGMTDGQEPARLIVRLKFYADRSHVGLFHTVEFLHADPRDTFVQGMGLSLPLQLGPGTEVITAGGESGPVEVGASASSGLHQLSTRDYRIVKSGPNGPETVEAQYRSRGWLDVTGEKGGVSVLMRNMWQEAPKAITYDAETGLLTAWLWPESAPLMDVRRYSNFPHRAQGESVGGDNLWVYNVFYPAEPFVGIARTHELTLYFHGPEPDLAGIDSLAADLQSPSLVYAGFEQYRDSGITLKLPDYDQFPKITRSMDDYIDFWLFHQRLWNWQGFWDFGDIQHYFRGGYGDFIEPVLLKELWNMPEAERPNRLPRGDFVRDYRPQQDWAFDNGRWGWTNTEGLPGLYFQNEYFRTGRRDVFFAAEGLARHSRDVVTRHAGRWFGSGTRHGVQHWSCGGHQERQTVFSEYRFHYYLTGEGRSRDVMARLADEFYAVGNAPRALHHTRLYGLLTRWEMTGDEKIGRMVEEYARGLIVPEGIAGSANIEFTEEGVEVEPIGDINTPNMMFHNFGAFHALLEYYYLTGDPDMRKALIQLAESMIERDQLRLGNHAMALGFAARYADDPEPILAAIEGLYPRRGWQALLQTVSGNPAHWSGDTAFLIGSVAGSLFLKHSLPTFLTGLDSEPELEGGRLQTYQQREAEGISNPKRPLKWQHEYDADELKGYFERWRPVEVQDPEYAIDFEVWTGSGPPPPAADWEFERSPSTLEERFADQEFEVVHSEELPREGWRFRTDPDQEGHRKEWFQPAYDDEDWQEMAIEQFWQDAGVDYIGNTWYRREVEVPDQEFDALEIHFGAVDESAWVWINGQFAGYHHIGPAGWEVPFALEVGELVEPGQVNQITIMAMNTGAAGGIWRPVEWRFLKKQP